MHQSHPLEDLADLRSSMVDGYTPEDVNRAFSRVEDVTGIRLICAWDFYDDFGFGGNSDFFVERDGEFHHLAGDLWQWLNGSSGDPETPTWPSPVEMWIGQPAHLADPVHDDGFHNIAASPAG
ncbi:hypothetical protein ACF09H_22240 [Streptomyces sp. NPDC014983]|uniref:hypothetical protein n=1 Tax=Streptomyces sp. NPDC014983 TaxID=3364933 RepID=UPI0036FB6899